MFGCDWVSQKSLIFQYQKSFFVFYISLVVVYIIVVYFLEFTAETLYFTSFIFWKKLSLSHFSIPTLYLKRGELSPAEFRTQGSQGCQEDEVLEPEMIFGWKKLSGLKTKIKQRMTNLQNPTQSFTKSQTLLRLRWQSRTMDVKYFL